MKKCIKLLSCIMVFAIVLATVVLPVSAAGNLATSNTFEYNGNTYTPAANGVVTVSGVTGSSLVKYINVEVEAGKTYYFYCSWWNPSKKEYQLRFDGEMSSQVVNVDGSAFDPNVNLQGYQDQKAEVSGVYKIAEGDLEKGKLHFGPRFIFGSSSYSVYFYADQVEVYEVSDFAVSTDVKATNMSVNPVITYTFTNPLKADLTAANFEENVTVKKISSTVYEVSLSNLEVSTDYSLTLKAGVEDKFGNVLDANTINFRTESRPSTKPVAENLLAVSGLSVRNKGTGVTNTKEADGSYTINVSAAGDTISLGRVALKPGVYVGTVEVMNVNVPGENVQVYAQRHGISANGADGTHKVKYATLNTEKYTTAYSTIVVTPTDAEIADDDRSYTLELGIKLATADAMTGTCQLKARNFQLRKLQSLDWSDGEYSAVAVKEGSNAALYITGPADSKVYFLAASYNGGEMTDVKFGSTTLAGDNAPSKIAIAADEDYKLFIWDSNMKPLNTTFEVSALK